MSNEGTNATTTEITQTAPTGTTNTAPAADPADWLTGAPEDVVAHLKAKKLLDKHAVATSYVHLEKLMSGGPESYLKLPTKPSDTPEGKDAWNKIYDRLGRPAKPEEYQIIPEGKDPTLANEFAKTFHELGLSKKQAEAISKKWNEVGENLQKAEQAKQEETVKAAEAELKKKWGNAYEQNMGIAKKAAEAFPDLVTDENMAAIEQVLGTAKTLQLFHAFMTKTLPNSKFETGDSQGFGGAQLSPSEAKLQLASLGKDADFIRRLSAREVDAVAKWNRLNQMAVGYQG